MELLSAVGTPKHVWLQGLNYVHFTLSVSASIYGSANHVSSTELGTFVDITSLHYHQESMKSGMSPPWES